MVGFPVKFAYVPRWRLLPTYPVARFFIVDFVLTMSTTRAILDAARFSLSPSRIGTYETVAGARTLDDPNALALYAWNAMVSAALLAPLHIFEVIVRNAVADALDAVYGPRWPWEQTFVLSLPNPQRNYNPRRDLLRVAATQPSTGKAMPELKFVFWQEMFTRRHDVRLWNTHLKRVFPSHSAGTVATLRKAIYVDMEVVRRLRKRVAHHEPIFTRNLVDSIEWSNWSNRGLRWSHLGWLAIRMPSASSHNRPYSEVESYGSPLMRRWPNSRIASGAVKERRSIVLMQTGPTQKSS